MLLHSKKRYEDAKEQLSLFGQIFATHLNNKHDSELDILYFDIVSRIANNLFCLTLVPPQKATVVATRLILRSIFSDLILAFALLCSERNYAKNICRVLNVESDEKQKKAFVYNKTIAENIPSFGVNPNSVTRVIEFLETKISQNKAILKNNGLKKSRMPISTLADILGNSSKNHIPSGLKELLHSAFIRLSQAEHYSISGRNMSKFNKDEIFFFSTYSDWLAIAIYYLLNALAIEYSITEFEAKIPEDID